ncbi:MAG: hypothetical protein KF830_15525 [Planctomycetes bacterium]|nr:hypothetical protein [Planctomycetota bacterium]
MKRHLVTVLSLATALPIAAQAGKPAPERREDSRLEERAQSMREQIDGGRTVRSHVRVVVRLKNGNKLRGVVKDGRFVERVDGLRFVDAQAQEPGAGIRLWYTSGARNYVFVPFADFAEYQVLQRISAEELELLEQQMQTEEARRAAARAAAAKAPPAGGNPPDEAPPAADAEAEVPPMPRGETRKVTGPPAGGADDGAGTEQQRSWYQLLQDYPPAAGWNRPKRDEIARRLAVIGAKPSEFEQRFVDRFADWEKACAHFGVDEQPKPVQSGGEGGDAGGQGNRRRRR